MPEKARLNPEVSSQAQIKVLYRARNRCEKCGAMNYKPHPINGRRVVLEIVRIDKTKGDDEENLKALCEKCRKGREDG